MAEDSDVPYYLDSSEEEFDEEELDVEKSGSTTAQTDSCAPYCDSSLSTEKRKILTPRKSQEREFQKRVFSAIGSLTKQISDVDQRLGSVEQTCFGGLQVSPRDKCSGVSQTMHEGEFQKKIFSALNNMTQQLTSVNQRLKSIEENSAASTTSKPLKVHKSVRSAVRNAYKTLLNDRDTSFQGFSFLNGHTYKSTINFSVKKRIMDEVHQLYPQFQITHVEVAIYTYFKTLKSESARERRGVQDTSKTMRRRRERLQRKLQRRIKTLSTLNMEENEVKKWSKVLKMEYISSEESDGEDSIDSGIVIKPLSWRSKRLNSMFDHLDQQVSSTRSSQALRQTKKRVISDVPSTRMVPRNIPKWAIANTP